MATTLRMTGLAALLLGLVLASPAKVWAATTNNVSSNILAENKLGQNIFAHCSGECSEQDFNGAPPKKPPPKRGATQSSGSR